MKSPLPCLLGVAGLAAFLLLARPAPSHGDAATDAATTAALVEDITAQHVKLVENQTTIDGKVAQIAEEVRQARLFVSRGGGKR